PGTRRGVSGAVYGPALADAVGQARGAVRDWRSTGRSGAGPIHAARGSTRGRRAAWVMAGSLALALVLGLAGLSFVMRAIGPFLPNIPAAIMQRTTGLAPALLAALVAIQLTGPNGLLHLDVKVPAVVLHRPRLDFFGFLFAGPTFLEAALDVLVLALTLWTPGVLWHVTRPP